MGEIRNLKEEQERMRTLMGFKMSNHSHDILSEEIIKKSLIKEQDIEVTSSKKTLDDGGTETTTTTAQEIDLPADTFPSGAHALSDIDTEGLQTVLVAINDFIAHHPNGTFSINIEASESQVPNQAGFEVTETDPAPLATERATTIQNYLTTNIPSDNITYTIDAKRGTIPWEKTKGKGHHDYTDEQFIKLHINLIDEVVEIDRPEISFCNLQNVKMEGKRGMPPDFKVNPTNKYMVDGTIVVGDKEDEGTIVIAFNPLKVPDALVVEYPYPGHPNSTTYRIPKEPGFVGRVYGLWERNNDLYLNNPDKFLKDNPREGARVAKSKTYCDQKLKQLAVNVTGAYEKTMFEAGVIGPKNHSDLVLRIKKIKDNTEEAELAKVTIIAPLEKTVYTISTRCS